MAAIEADILRALRTHLIAFAQSRGLPVAFTNVGFVAPSDGRYLRETFFLNGVRARALKAAHQLLQGLYQIDVMWPQNVGQTDAMMLAAEVADLFTGDGWLNEGAANVRVVERPTIAGLMIDDSRAMVPVTCRWECATRDVLPGIPST